MFQFIKIANRETILTEANTAAVWRLTALWAFSEAVLGGILHAFSIPFTGIFVGGAAVLFISLIGYYSDDRLAVIKSTLVVILVKGIVSPHTPLTAYLAVFIEGLAGQIIFYKKFNYKLSALLTGLFVLVYSGLQKIIILTLIFGYTLWESIDEFAAFIIKQFTLSTQVSFNLSYILIGLYLSIHLAAGILAGLLAGKIPGLIKEQTKILGDKEIKSGDESFFVKPKKKNHKPWWKKPSGIIFLSFIFIVVILSYFYPGYNDNRAYEIIIMLVRSMVILFIWYSLLSPLLLKLFQRYLKKKQNRHSEQLNRIISLFPHFKSLVSYSWGRSKEFNGFQRLKTFLSYTFTLLLLTNFD